MSVGTASTEKLETAEQVVNAIAASEAEFLASPGKFAGFVRKVTKTRVDFHWARAERGKPDEMTVNKHGVVCSRSVVEQRTWFGYTLDPFGPGVRFSAACDAAQILLKRFVGGKQSGCV